MNILFSFPGETTPLLGGKREISAWKKFLQGLEPIDREDWSKSNIFWKFFLICKAPAVFCLNLTIPVVDYDKPNNNWNKWLNVLHCITMPVFGVMVTKAGNHMIAERLPVWSLALCGGLVLALIVAMTTRNDRQPWGHCLLAYVAFVISVIWIYSTANEIVNLLQTFGIVFGLSDAILGLTFLAWGNSIGDFVSNTAMARQGFSRMAVSACFGGPLLNMLLGIGISCTVVTVSRGHAIPLHHRFHQYQISAGFLAASLSSSAILIPLMGFKVPRMYGVYLIVLYIAYLAVSIAAEIEHI
ncbi:Mitochondrial sodium/calcium exchanger protein [Desmophyllum pertusum]|uniref:Mitochondrial sodium/calcium exchanger protein n=1 Tax=Desmophyllum pertusum TaxID=174260 RepID=A0A9W9Z5C5_9CNID|nr:Mitochondrial sodium/calcium exchanger protein [Desmophyllum pertusum]